MKAPKKSLDTINEKQNKPSKIAESHIPNRTVKSLIKTTYQIGEQFYFTVLSISVLACIQRQPPNLSLCVPILVHLAE